MRKWNAILSAVILLLFLAHAILGGFQLLGVGDTALKHMARGLVALIAAHLAIGCKLTADSLRVWRRSGVSYWRENQLFWARRISGFAIMLLLGFHLYAFGYYVDGAYRLHWFNNAKLCTQILLVAALAVHVVTNVRPMLISFGVKGLKRCVGDILAVLSIVLLFMAVTLVLYYLRWNVG